MQQFDARTLRMPRWTIALSAFLFLANVASARTPFIDKGEPVHPACVHALVMQSGDQTPVTTAVSLVGCLASERAKASMQFSEERVAFEDDAVLGGGSFGYRELSQLDNGIYILGIRRVLPDGEERVSLAAIDLVDRPMLRSGTVVQMKTIELVGEIWVPDIQVASFRAVGNVAHFTAGVGSKKMERRADFTRIGKMRR